MFSCLHLNVAVIHCLCMMQSDRKCLLYVSPNNVQEDIRLSQTPNSTSDRHPTRLQIDSGIDCRLPQLDSRSTPKSNSYRPPNSTPDRHRNRFQIDPHIDSRSTPESTSHRFPNRFQIDTEIIFRSSQLDSMSTPKSTSDRPPIRFQD
jgi:hypothetical protein